MRINIGLLSDCSFVVALLSGLLLAKNETIKMTPTFGLVALFVLVCLVSCVLVSEQYETLGKFVLVIFIAWLASLVLRPPLWGHFIKLFILFGVLYSLIVLISYSRINLAIAQDTISYLPISYVPALSLAIVLAIVVFDEKFRRAYFFIVIAILLVTVFAFEGRGNALFPLFSVLLIALGAYARNLGNLMKVLLFAFIIGALFLGIFVLVSGAAMDERMLRLFTDIESEPRTDLYAAYFEFLTVDYNWVLGVGFNNGEIIPTLRGETYPHNYLLQMFSDLGLTGLLIGLIFTLIYLYCIVLLVRKADLAFHDRPSIRNTIYALCAGSIFVVLSHCKSYNLFAGFSLIILLGLVFGAYSYFKAAKEQ